ncbi:MAG: hypothetical protein F4Y49_06245 [Dehalococcoidia bacterium]|nr:hypothetical protein [Dehalococcoidia bacterium]
MNVKIWYTSAAILGGLATFIYVYIDRLDHLRYVSEIRDGPPVQTFDPAVFQFVLGLSVLFVPIGACAGLLAVLIISSLWRTLKSYQRRRSRRDISWR